MDRGGRIAGRLCTRQIYFQSSNRARYRSCCTDYCRYDFVRSLDNVPCPSGQAGVPYVYGYDTIVSHDWYFIRVPRLFPGQAKYDTQRRFTNNGNGNSNNSLPCVCLFYAPSWLGMGCGGCNARGRCRRNRRLCRIALEILL
ncbi:hypothetical protein D3C78_1210480 [compost metagenome]